MKKGKKLVSQRGGWGRHWSSRVIAWGLIFTFLAPVFSWAFAYEADQPQGGLCAHHPEHDGSCGFVEAVEAVPCAHVHDGNCGFAETVEAAPCGHVHDRDCGFAEAADPAPCTHVHDGGCGFAEAVEAVPCGHTHDDTCGFTAEGEACTHRHDEACGYTEASEAALCTHIHDEACGFAEAAEAAPCTHVHDGSCGFAEAVEAVPCGHAHNELCGYARAREGSPCGYVCPLCVTGWTWNDADELLLWSEESNQWGLGVPGASPEAPVTRELLTALLPESVSAVTKAGEKTVGLSWDLSALPEEGSYQGQFILTAGLEGDYTLTESAPALYVLLVLGESEMYAPYTALALNEWTWEGFDKQGTNAVVALSIDEIDTPEQLVAALQQMLPKRIYGSSSGNKMNLELAPDDPYQPVEYVPSVPAKTWGYLKVDWSDLNHQVKIGIENGDISWEDGKEFVLLASKPTRPGATYYINNGWDKDATDSMPITVRPVSFQAHTVSAANPDITVNLFDYWVKTEKPTESTNGDILDKSDSHYHEEGGEGALGETPSLYSAKEDWNLGINKNHLLLFGDGMIHAGLWNKGAGSNCRYGRSYAGMEGIVKNVLSENGYPELNLELADNILTGDSSRNYELIKDYKLTGDHNENMSNNSFGTPGPAYDSDDIQNLSNTVINAWGKDIAKDAESLDYLFDPNNTHPFKRSYLNVAGLFQLDDNGYFYYNMRENFAEFSQEGGNHFILYDAPATTRTDRNENPASYGNFFPFNKGSEVFNGLDDNGTLASTIYCANNSMNHHLGMTVEAEFRQPANGVINTGSGPKPMTFEFSGDDDVWVFIDDVLVLDLGGIHSELYGVIDFASGDVLIGRGFNALGIPDYDPDDPGSTQDLVTWSNLKELYQAAEKEDAVNWNGNTYASNTSHTLKMFYLERGNYDSSLALRFNLQPLLHQRITKVDQNGNPVEGVQFELYPAERLETETEGAIQCLYTDSGSEKGHTFYVKQSKPGQPPLVSLETDKDGSAVFKDGEGYFNFADRGDQYYILHEKTAPDGYRKQPIDIVLHYDMSVSELSVANRWTTGAYACSVANVAAGGRLKYGSFSNGQITSGSRDVSLHDQESGLVVAVPLLEKDKEKGVWLALHGSNLHGFDSSAELLNSAGEDVWKNAILTAALEQAALDKNAPWHLEWDEGNSRLKGELFDLPGLATRYKLNNPESGDMHMVYGIIPAQALADLLPDIEDLDKDGKITAQERYAALRTYLQTEGTMAEALAQLGSDFQFLNLNQFNRDFRSMIYIPNERRELWVMKVDETGAPCAGAEFGLFVDSECNEPVTADGQPVQGATDADGMLIFSPTGENGKAGQAKMPWADSANGARYYLKEVKAPDGYQINHTVIPVVVGIYSIYADAGTAGNGVQVMAGVGRLTQTMRQYAKDNNVDVTLQDITAFMQAQESGSFYLEGWKDTRLEDTELVRSMNLHFGKNAEVDYGLHDVDGGTIYKPFFITETGYIRARVQQNHAALTGDQYDGAKPGVRFDDLADTDLTNLFSLLNVVVVTDRQDPPPETGTGQLTVRKKLTGNGLTSEDYTKLFRFTVNLTDPEGHDLPGSFDYYFYGEDKAGQIQNNGKLLLHHDEAVTILGLPEGTRFTVTEENEPDDVWYVTPESGVITGTIAREQTQTAAFVNRKEKPEEPPETPTGQLTIRKDITGDNLTASDHKKSFTFTVVLTDKDGKALTGEFDCFRGEDKTGTIASGGELSLCGGESVTIQGLPDGTRYTVTETKADGWTAEPESGVITGAIAGVQTQTAAFVNHKDSVIPPTEPDKPNKPDKPNEPEEPKTPEEPKEPEEPENPEQPNEPEEPKAPEEPKEPENPQERPPVLPDPSDPDSPDEITIWEDDVPKTYRKVWDPEHEEWLYLPEDEIPLAWMDPVPDTGDSGRTGLWLLLSGFSLAGLAAARLPLNHKKDRG